MGGGGNLPIGPGIWGFISFFVLAIALWLLVRNMNSRLRRMAYRDRAESGTEQSGTEQSGPEQSGPEQSGPEQSGPERAGAPADADSWGADNPAPIAEPSPDVTDGSDGSGQAREQDGGPGESPDRGPAPRQD